MSRVQLALNVDDLDEAVTFYSKLFNIEPAKLKEGYANFAVAEPPLKLVLLENPGKGGTINHLGVEVESSDKVHAEIARLTGRASSPTRKSAPPVASPLRTRSGLPARPARSGRSTPSLPIPTPSEPARSFSTMPPPRPASAAAVPLRQPTRRRQRALPAADRQGIRLGGYCQPAGPTPLC